MVHVISFAPHIINYFKNVTKGNGYTDNIFELKRRLCYDYIQDIVFCGQGVPKVYFFKMSTHGPINGVDIVMCMQSRRDLENVWMMFDHVKCVQGLTTMGCHVYVMAYCKVLTIGICDRQSENVDCQMFRIPSPHKSEMYSPNM